MANSRDKPFRFSRIEVLIMLLDRATEHAEKLKDTNSAEYERAVAEVEAIILQLREAVAANDLLN